MEFLCNCCSERICTCTILSPVRSVLLDVTQLLGRSDFDDFLLKKYVQDALAFFKSKGCTFILKGWGHPASEGVDRGLTREPKVTYFGIVGGSKDDYPDRIKWKSFYNPS